MARKGLDQSISSSNSTTLIHFSFSFTKDSVTYLIDLRAERDMNQSGISSSKIAMMEGQQKDGCSWHHGISGGAKQSGFDFWLFSLPMFEDRQGGVVYNPTKVLRAVILLILYDMVCEWPLHAVVLQLPRLEIKLGINC